MGDGCRHRSQRCAPCNLRQFAARLPRFVLGVLEFAKADFAIAQRTFARGKHRFRSRPLSYVLRDHIDPDNAAVGTLQRVPIRDPDVVGVEAVGSLPTDFHACDGLAAEQHGFNKLLDLFGDLRNGFPNRSADMIGDGNPLQISVNRWGLMCTYRQSGLKNASAPTGAVS